MYVCVCVDLVCERLRLLGGTQFRRVTGKNQQRHQKAREMLALLVSFSMGKRGGGGVEVGERVDRRSESEQQHKKMGIVAITVTNIVVVYGETEEKHQ